MLTAAMAVMVFLFPWIDDFTIVLQPWTGHLLLCGAMLSLFVSIILLNNLWRGPKKGEITSEKAVVGGLPEERQGTRRTSSPDRKATHRQ